MRFEWNRRKAATNFKKHKISFDEAVTVFYDPVSATFNDPDHSLGEERFLTVGYSFRERLLVISYTENEAVVRVISARRATAKERKRHEA